MPSALITTCPLCGLRFGNRPLLELHIREDHRRPPTRRKDSQVLGADGVPFLVTSAAVADEPRHDQPAPTDMLVHHLFAAGLAVQSAAALADGPVAAQLEQMTDRLDGIICGTRTAVFESQVPEHRHSPRPRRHHTGRAMLRHRGG